MVETGKSVAWTITYPDGLKAEFTGEPYYKFDGAEVNQAIGFNLGIVVVTVQMSLRHQRRSNNPEDTTGDNADESETEG